MVSVWADILTQEEIYKKAIKLGITDFDDEKLQILKQNVAAVVSESPEDVTFPDISPDIISAQVKIGDNLSWPFTAHLCDSKSSSDFFRGLCGQSLANNGLLLYTQFQLENMIRIRDDYVLYLEENYKTVNGTELMDKYRRQHPESAGLLEKYAKSGFESKVGKQYAKYLDQTATGKPRLWREFGLMAETQKDWFACSPNSEDSVISKEKQLVPESRRKRRRSDENEEPKRTQRVKLESGEETLGAIAPSQSPSKRISPTKRKRLGLVGKR